MARNFRERQGRNDRQVARCAHVPASLALAVCFTIAAAFCSSSGVAPSTGASLGGTSFAGTAWDGASSAGTRWDGLSLAGTRPVGAWSVVGQSPAGTGGGDGRAEPLEVWASIPPQAHLIERVGGDAVHVHVLLGQGQSPHTFEPTPSLVARASQSDVCFAAGLPFEGQILRDLRATNPELLIVDSTEGIRRLHGQPESADAPREEGQVGHGEAYAARDDGHAAQGNGHSARDDGHAAQGNGDSARDDGHAAHDVDPHVWLSPDAAAIMAANVRDGLARVDPSNADRYDSNVEALTRELEALDKELAETLSPFEGLSFYVFHPAYGYFAEEYGLEQVAVERDGREPGPRELARVISTARERGVTTIFTQPQHAPPVAGTVASEIGAELVSLDPLGDDYFAMLRDMAGKIARALSATSDARGPGLTGDDRSESESAGENDPGEGTP